jgi:integrase
MNIEIIELQRELLLNQLMEVENLLNDNGIKKGKQGFTLFMRNGVFYVKYTDLQTGKQIPTNKNLHTTDRAEAETLAKKLRQSIIKSYYDKKNKVKDIITFFGDYYKLEKSTYLQEALKTGQIKISKPIIKHYEGFINNYFLPFLKENGIKRLNEITIKRLKDFQSYLLDNGLKPKTINNNINGAVKPVFTNLLLNGVIKETPFTKNLDYRFNLPESESRNRPHILNKSETLPVLLDKEIWKLYKTKEDIAKDKIANPTHYKKYRLLCLLMATTGLRNAEIFMLRKENLIKIRRTYFIDVVNSRIEDEGLKTESSKRKVPIPAITLEALNEYIAENNITDYLFYTGSKTIHYNMFGFAKNQFGSHCGYTEKELKDKNIDFYSFRHFYKTMLTHSNIKDSIVEYFMGHSVNVRNMNENYTHIEDLDDQFFKETGLKVIEHIDNRFQNVMNKLDLLSVHTHIEQVSLTDNKNKTKTYYTNVLNDLDFEDETRFYLDDLQDKGVLSNTNDKNQLLSELKNLLENEAIDKRRFDDCVDYIKNADFE